MVKGKYSALDVANYILKYCTDKEKPISNLHLQKMLYFTWIDFYKATGEILFGNKIEAWQLGPVVPEVYYEYCAHVAMPINSNFPQKTDDEDAETLGAINEIIDKYRRCNPRDLVNKTNEPGTPWAEIFDDGKGLRKEIPFSLIKKLECGDK